MVGKKDKSGGLGRALVRKHNQMVQQSKEKGQALRHQQRKVLESVTEISDIDAVVDQAEEAALLYSAEHPSPTLRINLYVGLSRSFFTLCDRNRYSVPVRVSGCSYLMLKRCFLVVFGQRWDWNDNDGEEEAAERRGGVVCE